MFKIINTDKNCKARLGEIKTKRGILNTPLFMPVGTRATVKTLSSEELKEIGFDIILSNTYHLSLRPGIDVIKKFGGLHKFMNWDRNILTDSGGYQVFSLAKLRKIDELGVTFQSHIDGSTLRFTPENVIDMQRTYNVDFMMILDECISYPSTKEYVENSTNLTLKWAKKSRDYNKEKFPYMFAIIQGGMFKDIRSYCAKTMADMDFSGYAIGGLSVGEPSNLMYEIVDYTIDFLPKNKPRYLMGVGDPVDILNAVESGIDMFDCVMPTRNARNGCLFTWNGKINIKKKEYILSDVPIDQSCNCYVCKNYSRGYLNHLYKLGEILGLKLNTYHNLSFFYNLMKNIRGAIINNNFLSFKESFFNNYK